MAQRPRVVALCAALVLAFASQAKAAHILELTAIAADGTQQTQTILDGSSSDLWNSGGGLSDGTVVWIGTVGAWTVNVTTGISGSNSGTPEMDLNSVNVTGPGGGGTLIVRHTDTAFTGSGLPEMMIGGTTTGTVTYAAYWGADEFSTTNTIATLGTFGAGVYSGTVVGSLPTSGTYSMTQVVTIVHTGLGITSFDANLAVSVPEQASIALVGLAFMLLGGLRVYWKGDRFAGAANHA